MAASERNPYKRGWYWRRVRGLNHRRLVFLDESAVNTAMTPTHGRAPRGERVHDSVPRNYGEQTSLVGSRHVLHPDNAQGPAVPRRHR